MSTRYFDPEGLARIGHMELVARQVVEGFLTGRHQSPYHGFSVEYLDHRSYSPGDEIRSIDWKILARLDKPLARRDNNITDEEQRTFKEAEPAGFALYNLREDIGETKDLASNQPEKMIELKSLLMKKYHQVRDESPIWPAWQFDNREGKRIAVPDYVKKKAVKAKK